MKVGMKIEISAHFWHTGFDAFCIFLDPLKHNQINLVI